METVLRQMQQNGYEPQVVIDCGANRGQWFGIASSVLRVFACTGPAMR
jgi:hypothetical protein